MKIKDGFIKREVMGQIVAVPTGAAAEGFNGMVKLNGTASFIWDCFVQDMDVEAVTDALTAEYDVSREQAENDVRALAAQLQEAGFTE